MSKININTLFLGFLIFDFLLLPKFIFSTPVSFFLLFPIIISAGRISPRDMLAYTGMSVILISSLIYGAERSGNVEAENVKRVVQLLLIMGLIFIDYSTVNYRRLTSTLKQVILLFYFVSITFLIFMIADQDLYRTVVVTVYPESQAMISENLANLRYSFHFTDPNSFGYLVVFCFVFASLINYTAKNKFLIFCASLILIVSTQSRGALLAFLLVSTGYWMMYLSLRDKINSVLLMVLVLATIVSIFIEYLDPLWEIYERRHRLEELSGKGLGGSRLDIWYYFFNNFNLNPFFGIGYNLEREGTVFRPHSDFIRMQLSYGTFIFFVFLLFFNRAGRKHLLLWAAFFVPFMINTIIDDYRLFGLFVVIYFIFKWEGYAFGENKNSFNGSAERGSWIR